jgi:hypothetical protein
MTSSWRSSAPRPRQREVCLSQKRTEYVRAGGTAGQQVTDHGAVVLPAQLAADEAAEPGWLGMRSLKRGFVCSMKWTAAKHPASLRRPQACSGTMDWDHIAFAGVAQCLLLSRTGGRLNPIVPAATRERPIATIRVSRVNLFRGPARDYPCMSRKALHAHSLV